MISFFTYDSLEECMSSFFNCEPNEVKNLPHWKWMDDGRYRVWSMSRVLRNRRKTGTWGFCRGKKEIHVWIGNNAKKESIISLLAHEIGHTKRPYRRTRELEESKAETYAEVAKIAFEMMEYYWEKNK